jgi:hypothetical protein
MTNVFTGWSVAVYVVGSRLPWPSYPDLELFLRRNDESPEHSAVGELERSLLAQGMFARALPDLYALRQKHTVTAPDGKSRIELPPELTPATSQDVWLCERLVMSDLGRSVVAAA